MSISASGNVTGTATAEGNFPTKFSVTDGQASVSKTIGWEVRPGLTFPTLSGPPTIFGNSVGLNFGPNGGGRTYQVNWGDGTAVQTSSNGTLSHTFAEPGRYDVSITLTDDAGQTATTTFTQTVHGELTKNAPHVSQSIVYEVRDGANDRVWNVNPDNDTVTITDAVTRQKVNEIPVGKNPRALAISPNGRVWITNKKNATISEILASSFSVESTIALDRGSEPHGVVINPAGDTAYVSLGGTGELAVVNVATKAVTSKVGVGANPRHLSVNHDGSTVYVSRFVSPFMPGEDTASPNPGTNKGGEVVVLAKSGNSLTITKTIVSQNSMRADAANASRGIPNYLGPAALSPDNSQAWLASKQDNIQRGQGRDGQILNHDRTVRSVSSRINLTTETESEIERIDHDNGGIAVSSIFGPKRNFVYVALEGSRDVAVIDAFGKAEINRFQTGRAPQGLAISPDGKTLFVHNFMSRNVTAHDLTEIGDGTGNQVPKLATVAAVASESLAANVLLGKQHFYDAEDVRLALQEYMSCASCHNDGGQDGRVWDLTQFGEGLRNTIDLRGKANHGALHWAVNFDEVHDFEGQIRALSGGQGFLTDAQFEATQDPFGPSKEGLSPDLDALADYVTSLSESGKSPVRNANGTLTAAAVAAKAVFDSAKCAACHSGDGFTDNDGTTCHDIGTGLLGDTPTLRGLWNSDPYLHDGSAPTLAEAIAAHSGVSLDVTEQTDLVAYLSQIDDDEPAPTQVDVADEAGPNLFTNAGFENDLTDWNTWNPVTIVSDASAGTNAARLSESLVVQAFPVKSGKEYELFGKAKTTGDMWLGFGISFYDLDGNVVRDEDSSEFSKSSGYEDFSLTAIAPANAKIASVWFFCSGGGTLTIDELVMRTPGAEDPDPVGPTTNLFTATTTVTAPFSVEARFSEDVTGMAVSDFKVTNGTASGLSSTSPRNYFVMVTPAAAGQVTIFVPAAAAKNLTNVDSQVSNQLLVSYQDTPPPGGQPESDTYTLSSGSKQNVTFLGSFNSLVVFATIEADATMPPLVVRVHNVTSAGYELTVLRLDGLAAAVADVKLHTFVLEEGTYSLGNDGAKMEVGKVDLVDSSSAWNGFTFGSEVTPQQSYTNPVVIGQMQTSFSDHWV